jgi:hypothetical protein
MVCVDLVCPFTIRTPAKAHSFLALTMIDSTTGWFEIVKAKNNAATSIQDFFITPGWHITRDLNLLSLTTGMWANLNVSSNKCVTIMALKPSQLQFTTYHPKSNAIIERVHKVVNDMLRSFYLENEKKHENFEEKEDNPFDYFLHSFASAIRSTYHTTLQAIHVNLCLAEI